VARSWWKWLLVLGLIPLLVLGWDRVQMICWVGHTDLEIEFVVVDGDSDQPVPGARIDLYSVGRSYDYQDGEQFHLLADAVGVARKECLGTMCSGTQSGLRFTDTYVVHLPCWLFRVSAQGFEQTEWVELDTCEYYRQAQRVGPCKARLVVQVALRRSRARANAPLIEPPRPARRCCSGSRA
jgi:hypothetical protein